MTSGVSRQLLSMAPVPIGRMPTEHLRHGRPKRVLVIGAGLAGLSAGYRLAHAGHEVTILEARDRPGGRVETIRGFPGGLHAEAGAFFIGTANHLVLGYCRLFGIPITPLPNDSPGMAIWYFADARVVDGSAPAPAWPVALNAAEQQAMAGGLGILGLWQLYLFPTLETVRRFPRFTNVPTELAALDRVTMTQFLEQQGATAGAIAMLRLGYFDLWGEGIDEVSALMLLRDLGISVLPPHVKLATLFEPPPPNAPPGPPPPQAFTMTAGNDSLPKAFAAALGGTIRYQCPVVEITPGEHHVTVTCQTPSGLERLTAEYLISAMPFSTLREVAIRPPLSASKMDAIESLPHTSVCRVYQPVADKSWPLSDGAAPPTPVPVDTANTDLPCQWLHDPTIAQPGTAGIIESYTTGARARAMAALPEDRRQGVVAEQIRQVFPGGGGPSGPGTSKVWDDDPWARGGYCWFRPGDMLRLLPHLASSEGRIFFAGDHTSVAPGWMEGAIESGHRAAAEVAAAP